MSLERNIILQIKEGNKNALVSLFKRYYPDVRKKIRGNGGSETDAEVLLKESLLDLWEEAGKKDANATLDPERYLLDKVAEKWLQRQNKMELLQFISARTSQDISLKKWALSVVAFFCLLLIVVAGAWWYIDGKPENKEQGAIDPSSREILSSGMTSPEMISGRKNVDKGQGAVPDRHSQMKTVVTQRYVVGGVDSAYISENADPKSPAASVELDGIDVLVSGNDNSPEQEIVVKKDILIHSMTLTVDNKTLSDSSDSDDEEVKSGGSLAGQTAMKLNPAASLPGPENNGAGNEVAIEIWKSPVNYNGYSFRNNKIILYGKEETDWVKLLSLNDELYMEYGPDFFKIDHSEGFLPYSVVNNQAIITQLKR